MRPPDRIAVEAAGSGFRVSDGAHRGPRGERRAAVFLDRDGTLNENPPPGDFVRRPGDLKPMPGAAEALRRLGEAGFLLVVFTNQSGVAKGVLGIDQLAAVNARLEELLAREGARLDGVYVCPHGADAGCECRKPRPGLLLRAAGDLGIDLGRSWVIGDSARDLEAGQDAGCRVILVYGNSYPGQREAGEALSPAASVRDLAAAAEVVLRG